MAEEIFEQDLIPVPDDEIDETTLVPVGVRPKKPTKLPVDKRQVFTPKLPEQPFGKSTFKFETTPFRETPESYQLRSAEKPSGQERLRREEMLAAKRGQQLKSVRQATPLEAKELTSAQSEQDIYDKFGPAAYATRKGLVNLVSGLGEPFTQSAGEFASIPGDVGSLLESGIGELGRRQDSRDRARRLEIDRYVIKRPESLFEKALPSAIEVGGQMLINPRLPKQVGSGFRPPPDLKAPPVPKQLPPGPTTPGSRYASRGSQPTYAPSATGMEFALIPSLRPGKAPVMMVPTWVMEVAIQGDPSDTTGLNLTMNEIPSLIDDIARSQATPQQKDEAISQLDTIFKASRSEGLNTISLLNHGFDRQTLAGTIAHETFHSGQSKAAELSVPKEIDRQVGAADLHDPLWAQDLPVIKSLLKNNPGLAEDMGASGEMTAADILAVELPAYVMGGETFRFFATPADGIDHLFNYFMHVADRNGVEALDIIERTATIREGLEDAIPLARSMYENWQRERAQRDLTKTISESPGLRELGSTSTGLQGAQTGGAESRSGQGTTLAARSGSPTTSEQSTVPTFYSQLERVVSEKFPNRMSAEQAMSTLMDPSRGIKRDEYDLSGLDELIASKAVKGEQVTKDELLDVIRTNSVKVDEVVYGQQNYKKAAELDRQLQRVESDIDSYNREYERINELWNEVYRGGSPEELDFVNKEIDRVGQQIDDAINMRGHLRTEIRKVQTAAPHSNWKALKGGIPGTDREVVMTLPAAPLKKGADDIDRFVRAVDPAKKIYKSGHYPDVENPVVHFRLDEGLDADGQKVLRVQEIQSDWHQKGREARYDTEETRSRIQQIKDRISQIERQIQRSTYDEIAELNKERRSLRSQLEDIEESSLVPDAPFKQSWPDLAFKRILRWAADNGFKRIVWPKGSQQIDLYNDTLRQNVKKIGWAADRDGIHLYPSKEDDPFGDVGSYHESLQKLKPKRVEELLGKNIAEQIFSKIDEDGFGEGVIEGEGLSIGGQLHKFLYDQKLPQIAKDYAKKFGSQYGLTKTSGSMPGIQLTFRQQTPNLYVATLFDGTEVEVFRDPEYGWAAGDRSSDPPSLYETQKEGFATADTFEEVISKLQRDELVLRDAINPSQEAHYLDISPKLSETARTQGFRLFAKTNIGDLVKVKGYSAQAEVVEAGDEPGTMKVRFENGTIDEFDVEDLKSKGPKVKDPMIKTLQQNPPTPPPDAGAEVYGPRPPLRTEVISTSYQEAIARKFVELMQQEKLDVDLTDPPSKQIYEALVAGDLREADVDAILKEEGVSWEEFINDQLMSYSKAGRDLSILSRLERNLERMLKNEPEKFSKYVAPKKQMDVILKYLNRSVLGRSLWSRYGGLVQKMVLTKLTTALVNTRTTMARAAADVAAEGLGAWMQSMAEGKGRFRERVTEANENAVDAMAATWEVVRALNPGQLEALINKNKGTAYQRQQEIINQVEKFFPDIHAKLFARPVSGETKEKVDAEKYILLAKSLLPRIKNASTRRDFNNQIQVFSKRLQFEKKLLGKVTLRGPEIAYDTMLIPLQFAEFLFRRPKFIGRLRLELMDRGIDLDEVLRQTGLTKDELELIDPKDRMAFKDIPEEAIRSSLNNTLDLTYAYDPSTDKEAPVMERAAAYFIRMMNAAGPGAILGELFPRALYNGMKTLYEYSPAPFMTAAPAIAFGYESKSPIAKILRPRYDEDPKTKTPYRVNPPTRYDWERLAKAMVGSLMLFVAWDMIRQGEMGDEWWQLGDKSKKTKDGRPVYVDVRKDKSFSEYFHMASLAERYRRGTIGDKQLGNELLEIYTGIRRTDASPDFIDTINAAGELFGATGATEGRKLAMIEAGGRTLAIPFTPLLNVRDVWAGFSEEENRLKDTRGTWYGPIQDKFPFWRRSLPDMTSPIEPSPMQISQDPDLLMSSGVQLTAGPNFAGQEWQRLGLNYKTFLERDPDPTINRAQNIYFEREISRLGKFLETLPFYTEGDDDAKKAIWEAYIEGDEGLASQASQFASLANPGEAMKRQAQGKMPGRHQRKYLGLDKVLKQIKDFGEERQ